MLKRFISVMVFLAGITTVHAQPYTKDVNGLCSTLVHKDITSLYTRDMIKQFFSTDDDLLNFVVYMNVEMERAGFTRFVVYGCRVLRVSRSDSSGQAVFDITGKGDLFFLKKHAIITTRWVDRDGRWYVEPPPVIRSRD